MMHQEVTQEPQTIPQMPSGTAPTSVSTEPPTADPKMTARKPEDREAPMREVVFYGSAQVPGELMNSPFNLIVHNILTMSLGVNPALVGLILAIRGFWDAFTDPIMAYLSDNFKSRWGRRRPFILFGGLAMIVVGVVAWFIPRGFGEVEIAVFFGIMLLLFATCQTVYSVPYWAQGIELSPSYHGRTRVALVRTLFARTAALSGPWLFPFCTLAIFANPAEGVRWLVVLLAAVSLPGLLLGALFTKERTIVTNTTRESFFSAIKCMLTNIHFLRVTSIYAILLLIFGLFGAFQSYLVIYYVCGGNLKEGALLQGYGGTMGAVVGIACIPVMGWLSRKIQKHHALNVAVAIMLCGTFSAFWLYNPQYPWLSIVDMAIYQFGVASIFTIIPSLHADVVDFDEYKTGRRREGMLGAAAAYLMKTAMAIGAGVSGFLINWTGFDVDKGGDQGESTFLALRLTYIVGASAPLLLVMSILWFYPLTEDKVNEVQAALLERKNSELGQDNS